MISTDPELIITKFPDPVGVMTLDDMLEAGDNLRIEVEAHGLIAFFLNNTFEDLIDLEAECLDIIRKKYLNGKITQKIMREFYDYLQDNDGDCFCKCSECENYYNEEDVFLCEHTDELICKDCCGKSDGCQECWKERNKQQAEDDEIERQIDEAILERCKNEKE